MITGGIDQTCLKGPIEFCLLRARVVYVRHALGSIDDTKRLPVSTVRPSVISPSAHLGDRRALKPSLIVSPRGQALVLK